MEEKLTIQHLAASLSYGLRVIDNRNESIKEVSFDIVHGDDILNGGTLLNVNSHFTGKGPYSPILHPLSDLTKPINHKGETFVPMRRLKNGGTELDEYGFQKWNGYYACDNEEHKTSYDPETKSFYQFYRGESRMCAKQYEKFQKLFEWHIDVFDLISKDLAIDLNSLDFNPYQDKIK